MLPDEIIAKVKDAGFEATPSFPYIFVSLQNRNVYPYEVAIAIGFSEEQENETMTYTDGMVAILV